MARVISYLLFFLIVFMVRSVGAMTDPNHTHDNTRVTSDESKYGDGPVRENQEPVTLRKRTSRVNYLTENKTPDPDITFHEKLGMLLSGLLGKEPLVRGIRNFLEIILLPDLYETMWLCKDVVVGVSACSGNSVIGIGCGLAGGFLVYSLADLGLTLRDIYMLKKEERLVREQQKRDAQSRQEAQKLLMRKKEQ